MSKPVLDYYFQNKQGIFQTILDSDAEKFEEILKDIVGTPGTVLERLLRFYQDLYQAILSEHQNLYRIVRNVIFAPPKKEPAIDFYDPECSDPARPERILRLAFHGMARNDHHPIEEKNEPLSE